MKYSKFLWMPALLLLGATSCTVDEPGLTDGDASDYRISSISSYGVTLMQWQYDDLGRMTQINFSNEEIYDLEYDGSDKIPSKITCTEYDTRWVDEKPQRVVLDIDVWTNIESNSAGMITEYDYDETGFYYDQVYDYESESCTMEKHQQFHETGHTSLTYNSKQQLLGTHDVLLTSDSYIIGDPDTYTSLTWQNNLMVRYDDDPEWNTYEYSDVDNTVGQWDPMNSTFGPIVTTGFFGVAPAKFFKTESYNAGYEGDNEIIEVYNYAYTLMDNGLIRMSKVNEDGETIVMTYNYTKK